MRAESFEALLTSRPVVGCFSKTLDGSFVEAMGTAGLDFVILDREHGPNSNETLQNLIRAAQCGGIASIVRVPGCDAHAIGAALDLGATGVQVPNIATPEEAVRVREGARFHPLGKRGVCRYVRAAAYSGLEKQAYFDNANRAIVIGQVEGREGLGNLEAILDTKAFDILFVGPYDLSQSLGLPGQVRHPDVLAEVERIAATCRERGMVCGTFLDNPEEAHEWVELGMRYIAVSVDVGIFLGACKTIRQTASQAGNDVMPDHSANERRSA